MTAEQVFAKCAWRLLPLMMILYFFNFLDRVNVGFAALTMNRDLGFTPVVFGLGGGVLNIGYSLFQVPAALILDRLGARRIVFFILAAWGVISAANAFIQSAAEFYAVRFLLGLAEAGFFPGMIFYLTLWFPQSYRARLIAVFYSAIPLSFVIGGPLSGFILELDGFRGLHGWQWLFLLEGLPVLLLGFVVLGFLPDRPSAAPWLSEKEKTIVANRLGTEKPDEQPSLSDALVDSRVLMLGLAYFGWELGFYGLLLWLPQIVQAMGFGNLATGFVVALPFLASVLAMLLWSRSSDKKGERVWHVVLASLAAAAGFAIASLGAVNPAVLLALSLAAIGMVSFMPPFYSLPSTFLHGTSAAGGIALISAIGRVGAFLGPTLIGALKERSGDYASGMAMLAGGQLIAALIVLALGRTLMPRISRPS
ncbi:MAG TPA: MFS transporter [Micropepsaceae bacterium]|nr:MFS transporter [Micropepsaceae bacterium]